jgi:hypothetical protein
VAKDQSWIADLLDGYKQLLANGTALIKRNVLNVVGATCVDEPNYVDPETGAVVGRTTLTIAASGGSKPLTPPSNGSWSVPHWWIDPVSGSDTNSGTSSGTPLQTYAALAALWGTLEPALLQQTTITFLSLQPDLTDPVIFRPIMMPGVTSPHVIEGTPAVAQTATFTLHDAKNRAAGSNSVLNGTMSAAATANALWLNVGRASMAWSFTARSSPYPAHTYGFTQSIFTPNPSAPFTSQDDGWTNGDSLQRLTLTEVNIAHVRPTMTGVPTAPADRIVIQNLQMTSGGTCRLEGVISVNCLWGGESNGVVMNVEGDRFAFGADYSVSFVNCSCQWELQSRGSIELFAGYIHNQQTGQDYINGTANFNSDVILMSQLFCDGYVTFSGSFCIPVNATFTMVNGVLHIVGGVQLYSDDVYPAVGPGNWAFNGNTHCYLDVGNTFVSTFTAANMVAPGPFMNGYNFGNPFTYGSAIWGGASVPNAANLDSTIGMGVGIFVSPGGASIGVFP